eukprot:COSAG02_NODE_63367_length_263_cov_0.823171_1_plen_65_part_10
MVLSGTPMTAVVANRPTDGVQAGGIHVHMYMHVRWTAAAAGVYPGGADITVTNECKPSAEANPRP